MRKSLSHVIRSASICVAAVLLLSHGACDEGSVEASLSDASSAGEEATTDGAPEGQPREEDAEVVSQVEVAISFAVTVDGEPFECGKSYPNLGVTAADMGFNDMRFYVHDVFLIDVEGAATPVVIEDDGVWQRDGVSLLDFEDGCENGTQQVNQVVKGSIASGDYSGVRFTLGVPPELNSSETVLEGRGSPLNQVAMFWSWKSGYKYLRLDGDQGPFRLHLGASGCTDDFTCSEMNLVEVTLSDYDADAHEIVLDLGDLLAGTDVSQNTAGTAPGCMGESVDPDCSDIFGRIGLGSLEERTSWSLNPKLGSDPR